MKADWIPIIAARRGLRRWWGSLGGLLLLLIALQTVFGQYRGIEGQAWLWLALTLLPGLATVYIGAWLNRYPHKIVARDTARALRGFSIVYLLVLLGTILLSQAAVDYNSWGLDQYLRRSYGWTMPLNVILLAGLVLFYFREESLRKPGAAALRTFVQKQLAKAETHPLQTAVYRAIEGSDLRAAFAELRAYYANGPEQEQLIVMQSEYTTLREEEQRHTIDPATAQTRHNRLAWALLPLVEKMDG